MILQCETRLNAIMLTMMPTNQDRMSKSQFKKKQNEIDIPYCIFSVSTQ